MTFQYFARVSRQFILSSVLLATAVFTTAGASQAHGVVRYDNGLWFDGERFAQRTVFTEDGLISLAAPATVDRAIDLEGGYVIPALANAHTHSFADGGYEEQIAEFMRRGVFYAANPNNIPRLTESAKSAVNIPGSVEVIYSNGGITGPGGHPIQIYDSIADGISSWSREDMVDQAYHVVDSEEALDRVWPVVKGAAPDFIKVYLERSELHSGRRDDPAFYGRRGLDPALLPAIVQRAHGAGLRVAVHVTSRADVAVALEAGADAIAHLPLERLEVVDANRAAQQGTVFMTTVTSHRSTKEVDDIEAVHRFNLQLLREQGARLVLGTDSHQTVIDEIGEVARLGGFTPAEMLRMATRETSSWILPGRPLGELKPDQEASFLVLAKNPLEKLTNLETVRLRVQRGHELQVAEAKEEKPSIAQAMAHEMMRDGIGAAVDFYHSKFSAEPEAWDFSEQQLNALGYQVLQHGMTEEAIRVFELNAEQYPESANVYDSLGEGLMKAGRYDEAITNYERSLELNPGSEHAREMIEQMRGTLGPSSD